MYPEYAEVNGKEYKLNTDFKVALECFKIIDDPNIGDYERTLAIIYKLFGFVPTENVDEFLRISRDYLRCGEDETRGNGKNDFSFTHDRKYINASFMSDYHIDLSKAEIHYWQFCELLSGLTETSVLSKVREIRNYDMSDIKDTKTRNAILRAKESVALPVIRTKEEEEAIRQFEELLKG